MSSEWVLRTPSPPSLSPSLNRVRDPKIPLVSPRRYHGRVGTKGSLQGTVRVGT